MRVKVALLMWALMMMVMLPACGRSNADCYAGSTDPSCPATGGGSTNQYGGGNGYDNYGGSYYGGGQQQGYGNQYGGGYPQQGYGNQQYPQY